MHKLSSKLIKTLKLDCKTIKQVHQVHAQAITTGLISFHPPTPFLAQILHAFTCLLATFSPSISTDPTFSSYVTTLFNLIPDPSTFCYNTIVRAHTLLSSPETALALYAKMCQLSIPPDTHTFPFALKACARMNSFSLAKALHCQALKLGFIADLFVCNNLIHVYSTAGDVHSAYKLFDRSSYRDTVSYNAMIDGFVKAGDTVKARELFDQVPKKDAVSWGTLLAGYAKLDRSREAIDLFDQMLVLGVKPDNIGLVCALSACAQLGELEKGKRIHEYILQDRIQIDAYLVTGLVDLYAKCGCIETARELFESSREKNLYTWNAMLVGFAMHGHGKLLYDYLTRMADAGIKPDGVTFLGVLVGCSHAGLTNEARRLFTEMEGVYGVPKELKHYGCMADLLGRAGLIEEAVEMIEKMPMGADVYVWGGLLGGCRMHGNTEVAEKVAQRVIAIKPEDGGVYSVLANVYANAERWDDLVRMRRLSDRTRVNKSAGCSLIQLNGVSHEFVAGDDAHPLAEEIHLVLNVLEQHKSEAVC
ncbi:pentatricopeptide repeat-containing protein At5g61800 [Coffea eugenioides]|uniref:pentatricopeptide repeat-containing protein At5g61800 n=1 Tax=Coffea eugenioides TaxID=49369 RepID=UPI000F614A0B|nr:pentatricopeptide repeat-containing protein At5g61800 [Coffea eugenioides]